MISSKEIAEIPISSFAVDQVAEMFKCCIATVYNYSKRGKKISNDIYVKLEKENSSRISKTALIKFRDGLDA